ncbi:GlxA family transcriptional regulator [Streptomyces malaysiensis]|uniref:GlxA family transcriptional regulator n=1 Tax=Streptomyces malaysiensis TaxID=92644 RepID=UPI002B2878A5|nr:helix-turn-helix domain-containing protein [Streptomyces malaysiensis]
MAQRRHIVAMAVADGAPVFELAVPFEVFGLDRDDIADPWYELRVCAASPDGGPVRTAAGMVLHTPYGPDDLVDADTVVIAACARPVQLDPPPALVAAIRKAHAAGRRIVSLCSGVYVLAAAGLLTGRRATTHWMHSADFARRHPDVEVDPHALYTEDDTIWTSAGTGAVIDLCLQLVRRDHGSAVANEVARRMVVPPHREGGQTQYAKPLTAARRGPDEGLAPVLRWARDRLHEPLTVPRLAHVAHLSVRTFTRRFRDTLGVSPLQWILQERIRLAQELLETTDEPVETVARRTGFGSAANLRHHFGRAVGVSPQSYRQVFRHRTGR